MNQHEITILSSLLKPVYGSINSINFFVLIVFSLHFGNFQLFYSISSFFSQFHENFSIIINQLENQLREPNNFEKELSYCKLLLN